MTNWTRPKEFYKGQLLWVDLAGTRHASEILALSGNKVEITPLASAGTTLWVDKDDCYERRIS